MTPYFSTGDSICRVFIFDWRSNDLTPYFSTGDPTIWLLTFRLEVQRFDSLFFDWRSNDLTPYFSTGGLTIWLLTFRLEVQWFESLLFNIVIFWGQWLGLKTPLWARHHGVTKGSSLLLMVNDSASNSTMGSNLHYGSGSSQAVTHSGVLRLSHWPQDTFGHQEHQQLGISPNFMWKYNGETVFILCLLLIFWWSVPLKDIEKTSYSVIHRRTIDNSLQLKVIRAFARSSFFIQKLLLANHFQLQRLIDCPTVENVLLRHWSSQKKWLLSTCYDCKTCGIHRLTISLLASQKYEGHSTNSGGMELGHFAS